MLPVGVIQKWAETVPPYEATAYVLIVSASLTLLWGLLRMGRSFLWNSAGTLYILITALLFFRRNNSPLPIASRPGILAAAGGLLALHFLLQYIRRLRNEKRGAPDDEMDPTFNEPPPTAGKRNGTTDQAGCWMAFLRQLSPHRVYLGIGFILTALFLFSDLENYAGSLLTWESPTVREFGKHFLDGETILSYTRARTLWEEGLMSRGQESFLYGTATYALFHVLGFNAWTLRVTSVVLSLASLGVVYRIGSKFYNKAVGVAAAFLLATNTMVLYYARYGTSSAATLFTVLLSVFFVWWFLEDEKRSWWTGPVAALSLYLATLHYAPGRLVVLILLGWVVWISLGRIVRWIVRTVSEQGTWRRFSWKRTLGFFLFLSILGVVWTYQDRNETVHRFHHARGEQFLNFLKDRSYLRDYLRRDVDPRRLTQFDKFELLYRVLERTIPQYRWFFSPSLSLGHPGRTVLAGDPPAIRLYSAPLLPFLVWGAVLSLFRIRNRKDPLLFLWILLMTVPLLLTNRVDAHRIFLFVIPLCLWASFGVGEAVRIVREAKVPRPIQHFMAVALIPTLYYGNVYALFYPRPPIWEPRKVIAAEIGNVSGPLTLAVSADHKEVSWLDLVLLERFRLNPESPGRLLDRSLMESLERNRTKPSLPVIRRLERVLDKGTLLLYPRNRFFQVAQELKKRGARVIPRPKRNSVLYRIDWGEEKTGIPDSQIAELPDPRRSELPAEWRWSRGKKIYLADLEPVEVKYGFDPPVMNLTCVHRPITMGGITYETGIGMHAWCRMTYRVPSGARAFQAIIGLSDDIRSCDKADVTFELLAQEGRVLYRSGVVTPKTPPRPVQIGLKGVSAVTLVVTEADNGRDCDHANWAMAAFLVDSGRDEPTTSGRRTHTHTQSLTKPAAEAAD